MKRFIAWLFVFFIILFISLPEVVAAKPRVRRRPVRASSCKLSVATVRKSPATHSISVSFFNLDKVRSVFYSLSYPHRGTTQAVVGTITPKGQSTDQRDLYLGTCSSGVCTPHFPNRANLTLTSTLASGCSWRTRYTLKYYNPH